MAAQAWDPLEQGRDDWARAGWAPWADASALVGSIVRVQQTMLSSLDQTLAPFQLRFARYETLMLLSFASERRLPISKLSSRLQVHSASMSNVLNHLERQGMVSRMENVNDRRSAIAVLTPMGRTVALGATRALRDQVFGHMTLSDSDAEELVNLLRTMREHAGDIAASSDDAIPLGRHVRARRAGRYLPFDPIAAARNDWIRSGWPDAAPGVALTASIMRVHQILLSRLEASLRPSGLTFARFEALMILYFARDNTILLGKLADRLQVHPASVTNVIKRLELQSLIRRLENPADGRSSFAQLMPAGRRILMRAREHICEDVLSDLGLTLEESQRAFRLLQKSREAAGDFDRA